MAKLFFKRDIAYGFSCVDGYTVQYVEVKRYMSRDILHTTRKLYQSEFRKLCRYGSLTDIKFILGGSQHIYYGLCFYGAGRGGRTDVVEFLLSMPDSKRDLKYNLNSGLRGSCRGGHLDMVNQFIRLGADDWDDGLEYACERNQTELIELMISKGAEDWSYGLTGACYGGHKALADQMITRGATHCKYCGNQKHRVFWCESED